MINATNIRQRLKPWMLPISMCGGLLFHQWIGHLTFLTPYLIFLMLFITFCRINLKEFNITPLMCSLLAIQLVGAALLYLAIRPFCIDIAQGVMICVLCPTATAAPVVTGMLGGSVPRLVAYSLLCNIVIAIVAPFYLSYAGAGEVDILHSSLSICAQVAPLILLPLCFALVVRKTMPKLHDTIGAQQSATFYLWAVALFIVVGKSVSFILSEPMSKAPEIILLALSAGVVCCIQFSIGRRIGARMGDKISGAQALGQKNTILAIWLALTYLNPIASIGPAAYIAWQNTINSMQIYRHLRAKANTNDPKNVIK